MARGKRKTTIIHVKSAPINNQMVFNLVELANVTNDKTSSQEKMLELMKLSPDILDKTIDGLGASTSLATSESANDYVQTMQQISASHEDIKKKIEDEFIEVQLKSTSAADNTADVLEPELMVVGHKVGEVKEDGEKKMKKKKKKSRKKKNKVSPGLETTEQTKEVKRPARLEPIKKTEPVQDDTTKTKERAMKNTGCFGFISTWLAKRKEKRREKKRKAIQAKRSKSAESLVVYEHKKARGGVAFTVEVDKRPMKKSVLPPISQRPGPIRLSTEQKLESAENKRASHISKKIEAARAHSRLVREVADRRAENEYNFKEMTREKIRAKEDKAFRAISRLENARNQHSQSRCTSRMESTQNMFTSKFESVTSVPVYEEDEILSECSVEGDMYYNVD